MGRSKTGKDLVQTKDPCCLCQELERLWGHPPTRSRRLPMLRCTFQKKSLLEGFRNLCWNQHGEKIWSLLSGLDSDGFKTGWRLQDRDCLETLNPWVSRLSGDISMSSFLGVKQVRVSLLPREALTLQFCITSGCVVCSAGSYLDLQSVVWLYPW